MLTLGNYQLYNNNSSLFVGIIRSETYNYHGNIITKHSSIYNTDYKKVGSEPTARNQERNTYFCH